LYFWQTDHNQDEANAQFVAEKPEVCLDMSRSGMRQNQNMLQMPLPAVKFLFIIYEGQDVVIVKNGRRICGSGGALSNAPIIQNKAYFEVKIQALGMANILSEFILVS
jgi:hypothetical protein